MEHQRCYIYTPFQDEERPAKRQRITKYDPQPQLAERLSVYRELWSQQEQRIQTTLEEADSATQEKIVNLVAASELPEDQAHTAMPAGLVVAGPSIASHGSFFARLGRSISEETNSAYAVLTSGESPNLKTFLKNLVKKLTSRVDDDDDDDDDLGRSSSSRKGPKLLDFDLGHVQAWQKKHRVQSIVVAIQDSEAFDTRLLNELVGLFHSWLDRLPFVLLFGIATSAETFEDRLLGKSLRYLDGHKFDVKQSDEIIEKLFSATVADIGAHLRIGPILSRRMLERQKDHVQNTQDFVDGLKYAYMSHFYASTPTIFLKEGIAFEELSSEAFEAIRNLPSFRMRAESMLDKRHTQEVRKLLDSNHYLYEDVIQHIELGQRALSSLSQAAILLFQVRNSLQMSPQARMSTIWTRAAAGELVGAPLLRETMLSLKKAASDKLSQLFAMLVDADGDEIPLSIDSLQQELNALVADNATSGPLRSQDDVRKESVRTTVVAQKVLLSKHKAALSEQDKAYSELVGRFHDELESYFTAALIDPQKLFLSEILMYDLRSPHAEVFQPRPRFAIERALASPHDYLGCDCCGREQVDDAALGSTQPATAILYQLYLESGALINVSDLWSAYNAIVAEGDEEDNTQSKALFQRALAELKYLGHMKPSRKKTDHVAKMMWKGL